MSKKIECFSILNQAYKRIESEKNWCIGTMAQDSLGRQVEESHPEACKYCLLGAIGLECLLANKPEFYDYIVINLAEFISQKPSWIKYIKYNQLNYTDDGFIGAETIVGEFNDKSSHLDVLSSLRRFMKDWKPKFIES